MADRHGKDAPQCSFHSSLLDKPPPGPSHNLQKGARTISSSEQGYASCAEGSVMSGMCGKGGGASSENEAKEKKQKRSIENNIVRLKKTKIDYSDILEKF
ncbi:uncharacterized protein AKAW2_20619S [Aspergillus luchuensis]|uniref:Uncharacterized protein n=1 Tax=Aspergillus kawachii TaxID=1069201 RepID=A0A7R7W443_ASPKA|nr:uncharacterized protein AKAW2_20619S [Aspergillus luchuensis]BCR95679.1 hypothetical protein AKAW2_20619S [Aspergillus luchuensis]